MRRADERDEPKEREGESDAEGEMKSRTMAAAAGG